MTRGTLLIAALVALSGCASLDAGGGGVAGSGAATDGRVAASIVRAMGGGLIGSIGAGLEASDKQRGLEAEYRALEYTPGGQAVIWRSSDPGTYGEVVAAAPYRVGSQDCRQYKHTLHIEGQTKEARGTACRNSDGSWTPLT